MFRGHFNSPFVCYDRVLHHCITFIFMITRWQCSYYNWYKCTS